MAVRSPKVFVNTMIEGNFEDKRNSPSSSKSPSREDKGRMELKAKYSIINESPSSIVSHSHIGPMFIN